MSNTALSQSITRADLVHHTGTELRSAAPYRPHLLLLTVGSQQVVVKDYRPCGWLLRTLFGPWLVRREARIYKTLEGCPGIPPFYGIIDRHAFAVAYIPGRNAGEYADGTLPREFFEKLQVAVDALHAHGVVHCDLKNRRNVVVAEAEGYQPYIIDFTTAFGRTGRFGLLRRPLYARFLLDDQRAVVKARLQVGMMWNQADADFVNHRSHAERVIRSIRNGLRWLFKLLSRGGSHGA